VGHVTGDGPAKTKGTGMAIDVKIPSVGESVQEAVLAEWYKEEGDQVQKEEELFVIETDKVTLEVAAEASGVLHIEVEAGETVAIGAVVATIDTEAAGEPAEAPEEEAGEKAEEKEEKKPEKEKPEEEKTEEAKPREPEKAEEKQEKPAAVEKPDIGARGEKILPPSVRRLVSEKGIDPGKIEGTGPGGRVTKGDVITYLEKQQPAGEEAKDQPEKRETPERPSPEPEERTERKSMSPIRKRIAARLLEARNNTAMLTTFNDVDMSRVMEMRSRYKEDFKKKHDISLGMMSFFVKASVEALKEFPAINAYIDEGDILYHHYYHVGMAIGSDKGLVVPVIRHADRLSFAEIEKAIIDFVNKIKGNKLELSDMEGGTFTITNGGVFGSLLSTPILNTPQSGILGMHRIEKRPVVIDDEIVIRPMMYLALSYDHRIVDGREAVTFLRRIKECVENPERILLEM
jgi:2-oxoglutarate dehydrogenase E2 component (dihydrolipoamide succinyltransferase)